MTVYVGTDFLLALTDTDSPHREHAESALAEYDVVTSPLSYLELLVTVERDSFNAVRLTAHLLDIVPVATDEDEQIVLKAANYYDEGMTPFGAFHAATADTRDLPLLSSTESHETLGPERLMLGAK